MSTDNPYKSPHTNAANAYRDTAGEQMNGFEITVELYKGIIRNIEGARDAHKVGRLDDMVELNGKTNKILIALQSNLNFEEGGEAATFLDQFYTGIFASLSRILRVDDPQGEFEKILGYIQPVYEIWVQHAQNSRAEQTTDVPDFSSLPDQA